MRSVLQNYSSLRRWQRSPVAPEGPQAGPVCFAAEKSGESSPRNLQW